MFKDIKELLRMYWEAEKEMHREPARFRHLAAEVANSLLEVAQALAIMTQANKNIKMEIESLQEELMVYHNAKLKRPA